MGDKLVTGLIEVLVIAVSVAIVAVLVSKNSQTAQVLQTGGQAFSSIIGAAVSPVTGGGSSPFGLGGLTGGIPSFNGTLPTVINA